VISVLQRELPADLLITDPDRMVSFTRDQADLVADAGIPIAVAQPRTTAEVSRVLSVASQHGIPVVPRGAGTGISGGAVATAGCLVLSLMKLDRILEISPADGIAVVQPGVLNGALKRAAEPYGLTFPPDPASFEISSIGGNLSTNAGGLRCMRQGITRQCVLGIEVVLSSGQVMRLGGRTLKRRAGYDLLSLFVGSEGTLGVITEATVRLKPLVSAGAVVLAVFHSVEGAGRAVCSVASSRLRVSALEMMDQLTVQLTEQVKNLGLDTTAPATLLIELEEAGPEATAELEDLCRREGLRDFIVAESVQEQDWLMNARRQVYPALQTLGTTIVDDVIVPRSRIPELLDAISRARVANGVTIVGFGHAGDGNFHPIAVVERGNAVALAAATKAIDEIMIAAIELGGSITGEHGVGLVKRHLLERDLDPVALETMRAVKALLDPTLILNPGKAL
jgi:glycolate oxidase